MQTDESRTSRDAVKSFLKLYFADEEEGLERDLGAYLALFEGHEAAIETAWRRVRGEAEQDLGRIANLRLIRELGRGAQGAVYLAEDESLERLVAVKVLKAPGYAWSETMLTRFRREATVASKLLHRSICPIYAMDVHEGTPYIVMPYLEGKTLHIELANGPLDVARALPYFEELAQALHFAHDTGIVHRDVKPSNILITDEGRPVLLDFGVAGHVEELGALTMTGDLVGTLPFLSPEQVRGQNADRRTDVYGLGVTMYEALTGQLPFDAPTQREVMNAIVHEDATKPRSLVPAIPRDLGVVIEAAMEKDVERRLQSAAILADELKRVREHRPIRSRPAGPVLHFRRWLRRKPRLAAGVLGLFAVLATALVISLVLFAQVDRERRDKDRALREIANLTDLTRLDALLEKMKDFEAPSPEKVGAMDAWLERADALIARLPEQEAALQTLRAAALPYNEAQRALDLRRNANTPH